MVTMLENITAESTENQTLVGETGGDQTAGEPDSDRDRQIKPWIWWDNLIDDSNRNYYLDYWGWKKLGK